MFSYRKSARSNSNAAEVFAETFPQASSSLFDVQAIAATTRNAIHNILRLTGEVVTDAMFCSFLPRLPHFWNRNSGPFRNSTGTWGEFQILTNR